ncbi:hypothetical protein B0H14DRAFT_2608471 [Mycena olivaceomarginata]|nr:hypothetical protein B0H14DRAFT_2608471 [Mycena olivaceomarginata]
MFTSSSSALRILIRACRGTSRTSPVVGTEVGAGEALGLTDPSIKLLVASKRGLDAARDASRAMGLKRRDGVDSVRGSDGVVSRLIKRGWSLAWASKGREEGRIAKSVMFNKTSGGILEGLRCSECLEGTKAWGGLRLRCQVSGPPTVKTGENLERTRRGAGDDGGGDKGDVEVSALIVGVRGDWAAPRPIRWDDRALREAGQRIGLENARMAQSRPQWKLGPRGGGDPKQPNTEQSSKSKARVRATTYEEGPRTPNERCVVNSVAAARLRMGLRTVPHHYHPSQNYDPKIDSNGING